MKLILWILSLIGILLVFVSTTNYGIGISPDSISYISAAKSLLSGNGFVTYDGAPFTLFPPLFPGILALLGLAGIDILIGLRFLNSIIFGLIIFFSGRLFQANIQSRQLVILGTVTILVFPLILGVSVNAL